MILHDHVIVLADPERRGTAVAQLLHAHGARCLTVRGPLRLREVLRAQPVRLTVWCDPGGSSLDVEGVWREHRHLRVVHLFCASAGPRSLTAGGQVVESMPLEAAGTRLVPLLKQLLAEVYGVDSGESGGELAFRNVVAEMWDGPTQPEDVSGDFGMLAPDPAGGLGSEEREMLGTAAPKQKIAQQPNTGGMLSRLAKRLGGKTSEG